MEDFMTVLNVAVIGGGNIGASLAYDCALRDCLGKGSGTTSRGRPAKDSASFISHNVYYVKQLAAAARYHADLLKLPLAVL
jgi:glycine/D-amino acid oxidase-like deaminating enzyme